MCIGDDYCVRQSTVSNVAALVVVGADAELPLTVVAGVLPLVHLLYELAVSKGSHLLCFSILCNMLRN